MTVAVIKQSVNTITIDTKPDNYMKDKRMSRTSSKCTTIHYLCSVMYANLINLHLHQVPKKEKYPVHASLKNRLIRKKNKRDALTLKANKKYKNI